MMTELPMIPNPPTNAPNSGVVVIGRFQPLHFGHEILLNSAAEYRDSNHPDLTLIICVGSSNRPQSLTNPWSADERSTMIEKWAESNEVTNILICPIPDIEDPPNWVSHAEQYHGSSGVLVTTDLGTKELYRASDWEVILNPLEHRERFEGWRVRETARMLSTIANDEAIREVLGSLIPSVVLEYLIETNGLHRLAFLGDGGEPVG